MTVELRSSIALGALALALTASAPAMAEVSGRLIVGGQAVPITHAYAFARQGFFDPKKRDVTVVLCDAALPDAAVRDPGERVDLVKAGKLHCVEQTIDADKQVINFKVQDQRFKVPEGGGSTEQVFEAKTLDGKTIAGRSYTKSPQKSFDDIPYSYDITFTLAIAPMR
jgi:hypothetical protein